MFCYKIEEVLSEQMGLIFYFLVFPGDYGQRRYLGFVKVKVDGLKRGNFVLNFYFDSWRLFINVHFWFCSLLQCKGKDDRSNSYIARLRLWSINIEYTVVCILVPTKSFPRFWRKYPYCWNKWYHIWTGCLFSLRWSKKNQNGQLKKNIFQLRQFSIFFHENFMDWSLGL